MSSHGADMKISWFSKFLLLVRLVKVVCPAAVLSAPQELLLTDGSFC